MSYITKNRDTMYKDEKNLVTLDKDLFAFASNFSDAYFANDLNWKKVAVHYKHSTSNQTRIIVLIKEQEETAEPTQKQVERSITKEENDLIISTLLKKVKLPYLSAS
jgi:hypothetical protein